MRIVVGIGKKFVIADSLAYMALNAAKADQATSTAGLWVLLYAYAFRLYFDFSGYSDIAIGIGQLFGIKLPENFNQPYLKRNITAVLAKLAYDAQPVGALLRLYAAHAAFC